MAARTRLGLTFPGAVSLAGSVTIFMMALSVFVSTGDLATVKIPLLVLYAALAYTMGKTVFRHLAYLNSNWNAEIESNFSRNAMENRAKLRPVRVVFAVFATMSIVFTATLSIKLLGIGGISVSDAARDLLSSLLGIPALLAYQYVMCARPSGQPTL
ncbi:hypothetical protein IB276_17675 [Ensifer sp. ENS04]|uniref:hypothetical protein n=1 Tax=Ensifer sp. ENS04 TaxID=2769281 RepID=UPI001782DE3A|nr:hypothetical protein [Ensifer sp. ENS04]MBD9541290.1 hypothetical protein [Ensifer sp. ENS04]